jgi:hypothetical protein
LVQRTLPGAVGAVDVVEARDTGLHPEVGLVVLGELLRSQLLQTVSVLGLLNADKIHESDPIL